VFAQGVFRLRVWLFLAVLAHDIDLSGVAEAAGLQRPREPTLTLRRVGVCALTHRDFPRDLTPHDVNACVFRARGQVEVGQLAVLGKEYQQRVQTDSMKRSRAVVVRYLSLPCPQRSSDGVVALLDSCVV
jgi:hypothetical protein